MSRIGELGRVLALSHIYETPPLGPPQPNYLNAAVRLSCALGPLGLLRALLDIERDAGRERRVRWGPRTLDLDILWMRGQCVAEPSLCIPHRELTRRAFALLPLLDVAPDASDPTSGVHYREVLSGLGAAGARRLGPLRAPPALLLRQPET